MIGGGGSSFRETLALLRARDRGNGQRRIEMALKLAHFSVAARLVGFDFEARSSVDPKPIRDLAAGRSSRAVTTCRS